MNRKLQIIREIHDNPRISQRKLAMLLDLSLGTINGVIQDLEDQQVITATKINGKSTEYGLTMRGHLLKAELSRMEAVHCYQFIAEIKGIIKEQMEKLIHKGIKDFVFYGEEDEIYKLLKMTFFDLKRFNDLSYEITDEKPMFEQEKQVIIWEQRRNEADYMLNILVDR